VQSSLLHKRIRALKQKHEKKVYAFVEDVCASGGYYIAVSAPPSLAQVTSGFSGKIYAPESNSPLLAP